MSVRLLVFDSGIGGLSVLSEIRRRVPEADIVYVADDLAFPYGDWEDAPLRDHIVALVGRLIERFSPHAVVIACNTAATLVLPALPVGGVLGVLGVLGVVAVLPALLLVSLPSFFPQALNTRAATSAASNTECFIFIPLKKMYF